MGLGSERDPPAAMGAIAGGMASLGGMANGSWRKVEFEEREEAKETSRASSSSLIGQSESWKGFV